ncbi:MAG: branched-chain amino acid ABC transporter permease [Deltaproteobacteria bacterium]|nr:branched-chain amino acid ABC transporter permease [Deltaproteobacteria bacterium]
MYRKFKVSYREDMALLQNRWQKSWLVILVLSLIIIPLFLGRYQLSILNEISIVLIGALGLNLLIGYTGQLSLAHGAFVAIGAYSSGLLTAKLALPFLISLPLSGLIAAGLGLIIGIPSLRLKGLYLALGTLAFGFLVQYIIQHWDLTQGDLGMAVKRITIGPWTIKSQLQYFYFLTSFAFLSVVVTNNFVRSKIGRSFIAIRDRDIAAEAMGIPIAKYKIIAFALSAFYAGIAGCLAAHFNRWIVPSSFGISLTISAIAVIIVGGLGTVLGTVLGAILITGIPHVIVFIADMLQDSYPALSGLMAEIKLGIFGLVIIVTMLFEPKGLVGIYQRIKVYWKTWPFKY